MKLSLRWIFDHLVEDIHSISIPSLVEQLGKKVTEIEESVECRIPSTAFRMVQALSISDTICSVQNPETKEIYTLPLRSEATPGDHFLVWSSLDTARWATMLDIGGTKDTFLPALLFSPLWKEQLKEIEEDTLLTISNTAITHRPDLWSHRGWAREVATILGFTLKPLEALTTKTTVENYSTRAPLPNATSFSIDRENTADCSHFAAVSFPSITYQASDLFMAARLARTDTKPINGIVDLTNYCMGDIGQPLHAFDKDKIPSNSLSIGPVDKDKLKLELLDKSTIEIPPKALVIKSGNTPLALAGIMGGESTKISKETTAIFVEAAHFTPSSIRRTASALHLRTEASTRFEKDLDSTSIRTALERFIFLGKKLGIIPGGSYIITHLGDDLQPRELKIAHHDLEKLLGTPLSSQKVLSVLKALGFEPHLAAQIYRLVIPAWRRKDIHRLEDIAEEIGRHLGWDSIAPRLPSLPLAPHDLTHELAIRSIKNYYAYTQGAHEIMSYPLLEEELLTHLEWWPTDSFELINPVAQTAKILTPSLVPHLIKAVILNSSLPQKTIRFFEINPVWSKEPNGSLKETLSLSSITYSAKHEIDFYEQKFILERLFHELGYQSTWKKPTASLEPWYHPYKTATLEINKVTIGHAGIANPFFLNKVVIGTAFIISLNLELLLSLPGKEFNFKPLSKYPTSWFDVSFLAPVTLTIEHLQKLILPLDSRISNVALIDLFSKKEWTEHRSITLRMFVNDPQQTLTKEAIDAVHLKVKALLENYGAELR